MGMPWQVRVQQEEEQWQYRTQGLRQGQGRDHMQGQDHRQGQGSLGSAQQRSWSSMTLKIQGSR